MVLAYNVIFSSCKTIYHDAFDRSSTNWFDASSRALEFGPWYSENFLLICTASVIYAAQVAHSSYRVPPCACLGKAEFLVSDQFWEGIDPQWERIGSVCTFIDNANSSIERRLQVLITVIIHCFLDDTMHGNNSMVPLNEVCRTQFIKCCRECGRDIYDTGEGRFHFVFVNVMRKFLFCEG